MCVCVCACACVCVCVVVCINVCTVYIMICVYIHILYSEGKQSVRKKYSHGNKEILCCCHARGVLVVGKDLRFIFPNPVKASFASAL